MTHPLSRRHFLGASLGAATLAGNAGLLLADNHAPAVTPGFAHQELIKGNQRFVHSKAQRPHSSVYRVKSTSSAQHPYAVVLSCSDSRVVPEIVFDCGIGDIFIIRVAGNVANEDEIASIEYAVEHLGAPLCVVLGHTNCGAVKAVVEGAELPPEIDHLVTHIREAHTAVKAEPANASASVASIVQSTVRRNVLNNAARLATEPKILREKVEAQKLRIEGAVYDLATGVVTWLDTAHSEIHHPHADPTH